MAWTLGFRDAIHRAEHFQKHGPEFVGMGEDEYAQRADEFLGAPKQSSPTLLENVRTNGDLVRFDPATGEFGILSKSGHIKTFFKPNPLVHGKPTNRDYFLAECRK